MTISFNEIPPEKRKKIRELIDSGEDVFERKNSNFFRNWCRINAGMDTDANPLPPAPKEAE